MVPRIAAAVVLSTMPTIFAFAPSTTQPPHFIKACRILHSSNGNILDAGDDFDPFLQSPLSFGSTDDDSSDNNNDNDISSTFGFNSFVEANADVMSNDNDDDTTTIASTTTTTDIDDELFDPLLSPHAYANGVDAAPVDSCDDDDSKNINNDDITSTFGFPLYAETNADVMSNDDTTTITTTDIDGELFDPLLSPHAYANGVDAAPIDSSSPTTIDATQILGILLIDHGSKRQASNDHIHNIAKMHENILNQKKGNAATTIVRAAHMEICAPSIIDSLRDIITVHKVTKVVCVPYFLSPGRHATEDVPQLIEEARGELAEEGLLNEILVSKALGTHLESMLGAVDDLVEWTLNEAEGN